MNADGSNPQNVTANDTYDDQPAWSSDGTMIAYEDVHYGLAPESWYLYVMNANGSNQIQLTTGNEDRMPKWSPSGTKLAFIDRDQAAIYLFDFSTGHLIRNSQSLSCGWLVGTRLYADR